MSLFVLVLLIHQISSFHFKDTNNHLSVTPLVSRGGSPAEEVDGFCETYTLELPENGTADFRIPHRCLNYDVDTSRNATCINSNDIGYKICTWYLKFTGAYNEDHDFRAETFLFQIQNSSVINEIAEDRKRLAQSIVEERERHYKLTKEQKEKIRRSRPRINNNEEASYKWAAKAMRKLSLMPDKCKPATRGRRHRHWDCNTCWAGPFPYPCNCNCRGWEQHATECSQPCSELSPYTQSTLGWCHKPCHQYGQVKATVGCGIGHDRVCVASGADCVMRHLDRVWQVADVLGFFLSGGLGAAKNVLKNAAKTGSRIAMKKAIKKVAHDLKDKARSNLAEAFTKKGYTNAMKENVLENGSIMFVSANLPKIFAGDDIPGAAWEIAQIADPTGILGLANTFIPPEGCDAANQIDMDGLPHVQSGDSFSLETNIGD